MKYMNKILGARYRLQRAIRKHNVYKSFERVYGPPKFYLQQNDVAVIIVGRNSEYFLEYNREYHRRLGAKYFVYIDNESSDRSVEKMAGREDTIVAVSRSDFKNDQDLIRFFATTLYVSGGWRLAIDADELFDYPSSDKINLPKLTELLHRRGYNCLIAQMLDLVPDGSISKYCDVSYRNAVVSFSKYDLNNITRELYHGSDISLSHYLRQNDLSYPDIHVLFGGLRRTLFGEDCCLTKHPLFRMDSGVVPLPHPHVSVGLRCADFSGLLRHYKFAGGFLRRETSLLQEDRIAHGETGLRVAKLTQEPWLDLGAAASECNATCERLLELGFLTASPKARESLCF